MKKDAPQLLVSDRKGKIQKVPHFEASGMKAGRFFRLNPGELIKLPPGSEIFMLPDRAPVGYDPESKKFSVFTKNASFPVAAFLSPAFTITYNASYKEMNRPSALPLFAYAPLLFYKGGFHVTAMRVDKSPRHDIRYMDMDTVCSNIRIFKKLLPGNRLVGHLKNCALVYTCPNARNFFLKRYEAPLPVSSICNADCFGCISYQAGKRCPATQPRIKFIPTPEEIADIALLHMSNAADPIVSFGQGCEGEPLLMADIIGKAIRLIRKKTRKGIININTNASLPHAIAGLYDCGLDSMRVSLNSARGVYYTRYYRPKGYKFKDIMKSIKIAKDKKGFVSLNYLTMPGFTDTKEEYDAFQKLLSHYHVDMIQWRNLNFDPLAYFRDLKVTAHPESMIGIREVIKSLKKEFPRLMMGYFNPTKKVLAARLTNLW